MAPAFALYMHFPDPILNFLFGHFLTGIFILPFQSTSVLSNSHFKYLSSQGRISFFFKIPKDEAKAKEADDKVGFSISLFILYPNYLS